MKQFGIREYAKQVEHEIIGKLTRHAEWELTPADRCYIDEGGNEYIITGGLVVIVTADGAVI